MDKNPRSVSNRKKMRAITTLIKIIILTSNYCYTRRGLYETSQIGKPYEHCLLSRGTSFISVKFMILRDDNKDMYTLFFSYYSKN